MLKRFVAAVERARSALAMDEGRLWGAPLGDVDWMAMEPGQIHLTAGPGMIGFERNATGLWSGRLPDGLPVASTALEWAGRWWSTIQLPLRDDEDGFAAVRYLVHEAIHVKQEERVVPGAGLATEFFGPGSGTDLLETAEGRIWLRLEVAALSTALTAHGADRSSAVADALLFRRCRLASATATEADRERNLDIREGMPEYSAWRLTGEPPDRLAVHVGRLPGASWVRSFAYFTGPAYGYLLDALVPDWRPALRDQLDLTALLAPAVADRELDDAEARGQAYDLDRVRAEERDRDAVRRERLARTQTRYAGPVLRIITGGMPISFDPYHVTPLEHGTVFRSLSWRTKDASELKADEGLVTANFAEIWIPLDPAVLADAPPPPSGDPLTGDGWTLRLSASWELVADDRGWVVRAAD